MSKLFTKTQWAQIKSRANFKRLIFDEKSQQVQLHSISKEESVEEERPYEIEMENKQSDCDKNRESSEQRSQRNSMQNF